MSCNGNGDGVGAGSGARATILAIALAVSCGVQANPAREGVQVGGNSAFAKLVPAEQVERSSSQQYAQMLSQAAGKNALAPTDNVQLKRLRAIAAKIIPLRCHLEPARARLALGGQPDWFRPDQRLLHAGWQDCVLQRHFAKTSAD